jgi:hypothetical protein
VGTAERLLLGSPGRAARTTPEPLAPPRRPRGQRHRRQRGQTRHIPGRTAHRHRGLVPFPDQPSRTCRGYQSPVEVPRSRVPSRSRP